MESKIFLPRYDVVIKSHHKDYLKLELVIDSCIKHLKPQPKNIYLITFDGIKLKKKHESIVTHIKDRDVVPHIDRKRLKHRPNWVWVNLVSILQQNTECDLYLDVQSDNVFLQDVNVFSESGNPILFRSRANKYNCRGHLPYFRFSKEMFDNEKTIGSDYTYISEFIMYDKRILRTLVDKHFNGSVEALIEKAISIVCDDSYPADQEIYGFLVESRFADKYDYKYPELTYTCFDKIVSKAVMKNIIKKHKHSHLAIAFHTYL